MNDGLKVAALVPVYNERETLVPLLERLLPVCEGILVVDDGSRDGSAEAAAAFAKAHPQVRFHQRAVNGGKGAALRTGLRKLLAEDWTHIATLDADLQHRPEDLPQFRAEARASGAELVIGSRLRGEQKDYPAVRRRANEVGDWWISKLLRHPVEDAQSGYRMFSARLLRSLELHESGFAIETEMLVRSIYARAKIGYVEIPAIYEGIGSYYRPVSDTYKICIAFGQAQETLYDKRGTL